jgi:diguanylate cyclase (GGDEF)-like protein
VTEARALQDQLRHQASHDTLTGLANRALFGERLATAGAAGVLLIDLDDFKSINDTYGYHVGDAVLTSVARLLRTCVPDGGVPARLGGDEFAVLLPGMDEAAARLLVARFHALLDEPMLLEGAVAGGGSVGVVAGEPDDPQALLRRADAAM